MSATDRLVETAINDPLTARAEARKVLQSAVRVVAVGRGGAYRVDERDEVAQDFVEVLDRRQELDDFTRTTAGREVVGWMADALESGSTHADEAATYRKLQSVLRLHGVNLRNIEVDA